LSIKSEVIMPDFFRSLRPGAADHREVFVVAEQLAARRGQARLRVVR
jgi:hypothetical protein